MLSMRPARSGVAEVAAYDGTMVSFCIASENPHPQEVSPAFHLRMFPLSKRVPHPDSIALRDLPAPFVAAVRNSWTRIGEFARELDALLADDAAIVWSFTGADEETSDRARMCYAELLAPEHAVYSGSELMPDPDSYEMIALVMREEVARGCGSEYWRSDRFFEELPRQADALFAWAGRSTVGVTVQQPGRPPRHALTYSDELAGDLYDLTAEPDALCPWAALCAAAVCRTLGVEPPNELVAPTSLLWKPVPGQDTEHCSFEGSLPTVSVAEDMRISYPISGKLRRTAPVAGNTRAAARYRYEGSFSYDCAAPIEAAEPSPAVVYFEVCTSGGMLHAARMAERTVAKHHASCAVMPSPLPYVIELQGRRT